MTDKELEKIVTDITNKYSSVVDKFKTYCQNTYLTDGYSFDDKTFEEVRPLISVFADFYKQQMVKDATVATLTDYRWDEPDEEPLPCIIYGKGKVGDKVKLIIIKEE